MSYVQAYAVIGAVLLIGCAPAGGADPEADRAAIRAVIDQEMRAGNAGDVEGFIGAFSDDAVAIPPGAPAVAGDAFREWARGTFESVDIRLEDYADEQLILAGDHAIHHYAFDWTITPKAGGEPLSERGQGIHVLRREGDGEWRITHDIWNADAPPGGM